MKLHTASGRSGYTLIECLVYIGALLVLLGVGSAAFFKCWEAHTLFSRNADDITAALHAGELWRADIRAATGPIQADEKNGTQQLRIPTSEGEIVYSIGEDGLLRKAADSDAPVVILARILDSHMQSDKRQHVTAWRWDLEMKRSAHRVKINQRPLFTFEAVPAASSKS